MFNAPGRGSWIAQVENKASGRIPSRLEPGPDRWLRLRSRGCALVGEHARGHGDWKGGGKIILAKRYRSDLQSQVRFGENFLSLR